jgi:1-phosphatidylinositol-4-phosphate 5-kinase
MQYSDGGLLSSTKQEIYYCGIIDILIEFKAKKKMEFLCKMILYCSTKMSCVPPTLYRTRFLEYINKKLINLEGSQKK